MLALQNLQATLGAARGREITAYGAHLTQNHQRPLGGAQSATAGRAGGLQAQENERQLRASGAREAEQGDTGSASDRAAVSSRPGSGGARVSAVVHPAGTEEPAEAEQASVGSTSDCAAEPRQPDSGGARVYTAVHPAGEGQAEEAERIGPIGASDCAGELPRPDSRDARDCADVNPAEVVNTGEAEQIGISRTRDRTADAAPADEPAEEYVTCNLCRPGRNWINAGGGQYFTTRTILAGNAGGAVLTHLRRSHPGCGNVGLPHLVKFNAAFGKYKVCEHCNDAYAQGRCSACKAAEHPLPGEPGNLKGKRKAERARGGTDRRESLGRGLSRQR